MTSIEWPDWSEHQAEIRRLMRESDLTEEQLLAETRGRLSKFYDDMSSFYAHRALAVLDPSRVSVDLPAPLINQDGTVRLDAESSNLLTPEMRRRVEKKRIERAIARLEKQG